MPQNWYDRYGKRVEDFHIPKEATKFRSMIEQVGHDGFDLMKWVREADAPIWLREISAVETLCLVWTQQFSVEEGKVSYRSNDNIPPASKLISSPYDREARMSIKRDTEWIGYKVHLTETCDADLPHLIVNVETTPATTQDMEMTGVIHQDLEQKQLLPSEHFMDTGYVDGEYLVTSEQRYGIELIGPVAQSGNWQAKDPEAYDSSKLSIDWENKVFTCPEGKTSKNGQKGETGMGKRRFAPVLDKQIVELVLHGNSVPMQRLIPAKLFFVHKSSMRLFKQEDLSKLANSSKNDMLNVLELKELFHKEQGLLTFVLPATLGWIKHISNMFLLLLL